MIGVDEMIAEALAHLNGTIDLWAHVEHQRIHEAANRAHRSIGQQVRYARARLLPRIDPFIDPLARYVLKAKTRPPQLAGFGDLDGYREVGP